MNIIIPIITFFIGTKETLTKQIIVTNNRGNVHCYFSRGGEFRTAFSELAALRAVFPEVPVLALTATAPPRILDTIVTGMRLQNPHMIKASPNRPNIYFQKKLRLGRSTGEASYEQILLPIANKLKEERLEYPLTVIYLDLRYSGYAYTLFEDVLGEEQYAFADKKMPGYRLFGQFHSRQTDLMKSEMLTNLRSPSSFVRVFFATSSLGMGVDAPEITQVVHIKPPSSLESYFQMVGRAGRSGSPATATLYYCKADISDNIKNVDDDMKNYCLTRDTCLRRRMLDYFGFNYEEQLRCCSVCDGTDEAIQRLEQNDEDEIVEGMAEYFSNIPFDLGF